MEYMKAATGSSRYSLGVLSSHPIQYFVPLYRRLACEPDIDVTVYFCSRAGLDAYEDEGFGGTTLSWDIPLLEGFDHLFLRNLGTDGPPGGFWSLVNPAVVRELVRRRHDAVLIYGHAYASYLLGVLGAYVAGSALFMRCDTHLGLERSRLRRSLRSFLMPRFYRLFDACLAIGSRNARFYRNLGVPERCIFHVPYAVENRRFKEGARLSADRRASRRNELDFPQADVPVVLFVSKLTRQKRPMDLLRAFGRLREQSRDPMALAFVGEGWERPRLESFVDRHDISDVHFLGFRNQSELPGIYGACDVFVLPSENESWGLVINEAMCAGLPIIAAETVGAAPDLVDDGTNGFTYPVGDVEALAGHLAGLLASRELRDRMGRESRRIIAHWDYEACVDGLKRALRFTSGPDSTAWAMDVEPPCPNRG